MVEKCDVDGQTGWIDTAMVYDALSEEMKARIEGMEVRHRLRVTLDEVPLRAARVAARGEPGGSALYRATTVPLLPSVDTTRWSRSIPRRGASRSGSARSVSLISSACPKPKAMRC